MLRARRLTGSPDEQLRPLPAVHNNQREMGSLQAVALRPATPSLSEYELVLVAADAALVQSR